MTEEVPAGGPSASPKAAIMAVPAKPWFRVFHVNDSTDDQVLFQAACRRGRVPFEWHVTDSAEKGISYLKTLIEHSPRMPVCWPDLVLLDVVMPFTSGFEVLRYIRSTRELKHLPVVIFTGDMRPHTAEESRRLGATAFRLKPADFDATVRVAQDLHRLMCELKAQGGFGAE